MITSIFVDTCFTALLNPSNQLKKSMSFFSDLKEIIDYYLNNYETPIILKNKIDCIKQICQMSIDGKNKDAIFDSISMTPKYNDLIDYMESKKEIELSVEDLNNCVKQVRMRKKFIYMIQDYQKVINILTSIDDGSYEAIDVIISDYEKLIKHLYLNVVASNKIIEIEAASCIDIMNDDYENLLEKIEKKYDKKNRIPTGMDVFDSHIFYGGVEKSRIYIFAGGSGSGKSTLLDNIMIQSAVEQAKQDLLNNYTKTRVYLLITLENQIDETFMRIYQSLFNKTTAEFLDDINTQGKDEIKKKIIDRISSNNIKFIIKYFQAQSISPMDIDSVISETEDMYGKESIQLVGVDYLDLMRSDVSRDAYRHELGDITLSLKTIAVTHEIPLLTVTQLNRGVYSVKSSDELRIDMMGESMQKVHNSDYVSLQAKDLNDDNIVHFAVGKNRSGISDIGLDFRVDFAKYKFIKPIMNVTTNTNSISSSNGGGNSQTKFIQPKISDSIKKFKNNSPVKVSDKVAISLLMDSDIKHIKI